MPEIGGRDGVEAARRFIQQQYLRLMNQCAEQAESLDRAGRKGARLAVQIAAQSEPFAQGFDAAGAEFIGKVVQAAKELQILAAGEPRIEAEIASRVVADLPSHGCWFTRGIVPGQRSSAACRQQKRAQDTKQGCFSGAIGTEQSDRLSLFYFQRDAAQRGRCRRGKRLKKTTPAAERGRKPFLQGIHDDRGVRHSRLYSVSRNRRQSARDAGQNVTVRSKPR